MHFEYKILNGEKRFKYIVELKSTPSFSKYE